MRASFSCHQISFESAQKRRWSGRSISIKYNDDVDDDDSNKSSTIGNNNATRSIPNERRHSGGQTQQGTRSWSVLPQHIRWRQQDVRKQARCSSPQSTGRRAAVRGTSSMPHASVAAKWWQTNQPHYLRCGRTHHHDPVPLQLRPPTTYSER